ncbi:MAG: class I SAM-dependent methyltransferase, partial [Nanoarchaeota archaeon]
MDTIKFRDYQKFDKIAGWGAKITLEKASEYIIETMDDILFNNESLASMHDILKEKFNIVFENSSFLDIGCGNGIQLLKLKRMGAKSVSGVTASDSDCESGKNIGINIVKCDMHELEFDDKTFDVILLHQSLEHAISPYIVLCEVNRILKDNGFIHIVIPEDDIVWSFTSLHFWCPTMYQLSALLQRSGFTPVYNYRGTFSINSNEIKKVMVFLWTKAVENNSRISVPSKDLDGSAQDIYTEKIIKGNLNITPQNCIKILPGELGPIKET